MNDRIKLALAVGWKAETHNGITSWFNRSNNKAFCDLPDPFTDANDDYAVLEWMLSQDADTQRRFRKAIAHEGYFKWDYKVGDYARALLTLIS